MDIRIEGTMSKTVAATARRKVQDQLVRAVGLEAHKLRVTITGSSLESIKVDVDGPEDLVKKVKAAMDEGGEEKA